MTKNIDDDQDFELEDDDILVSYGELDQPNSSLNSHIDARRRLERWWEEKELQRLLSSDFDDRY